MYLLCICLFRILCLRWNLYTFTMSTMCSSVWVKCADYMYCKMNLKLRPSRLHKLTSNSRSISKLNIWIKLKRNPTRGVFILMGLASYVSCVFVKEYNRATRVDVVMVMKYKWALRESPLNPLTSDDLKKGVISLWWSNTKGNFR